MEYSVAIPWATSSGNPTLRPVSKLTNDFAWYPKFQQLSKIKWSFCTLLSCDLSVYLAGFLYTAVLWSICISGWLFVHCCLVNYLYISMNTNTRTCNMNTSGRTQHEHNHTYVPWAQTYVHATWIQSHVDSTWTQAHIRNMSSGTRTQNEHKPMYTTWTQAHVHHRYS